MIRAANLADLPLLGAIEVSAGQRFRGTPMDFAADHPPSPPDSLAAALARQSLWVAVDGNDTPVGFLSGEAVDGWFHILEVAVAAPAQGSGHGGALLAAAAAAARGLGCACLSLTTDRDIDFNGPWYRRHGFVDIAPAAAPDWLAAIKAREATSGLDPARRTIMVRRL